MALQVGVVKFTGRLDNVIGYRRNGKYFFRSMPDKVRQTANTRHAARRFGMASRNGKLIRRAFRPYLEMRYDGTLVNRLNKLLIQSGTSNLHALRNFHFNRHTGLEKFFVVPPIFTVNGTLHIPAQELLAQGNNTHLELRLIATRVDFITRRVLSTEVSTAMIDLDPRTPFNGMALSVPVEGEGALMVVLQCRACKACNGILYPTGDRRYMAADMLSLLVPADQALAADTLTTKAARKRFAFRRQPGSPSPSLRGPQGPRGKPGRSNLLRE